MIKAKIYKPSRSAMQSGRAGTGQWVLEYEITSARTPEALMGWAASEDTMNQVRLHFKSAEDAIEFAQSKDMRYTVLQPQERQIRPRNYGDNFRYVPYEEKR